MRFLNLALLCLTILQQVLGSFKIMDSSVISDLIHFRSADFGYVPYGKILSGQIIISSDEQQQGCNASKISKSAKNEFYLVRVGKCSILQKAINAQSANAKMLIVIADHDDIDEVHMLNTGKTDKIRIPVLLFSKTNGDKIIQESEKTTLEAKCLFPRDVVKSGPVSVDYWFDPLDTSNFKFFYQFYSLHKDLGDDVKFRIHLALSFGQENADSQVKMDSCVSNGKYCAHDPDGDGPLKGKDVVLTGLAMLCLQEQNSSYILTKIMYQFDISCLLQAFQATTQQNPLICLQELAKNNGYEKHDFKTDCFAKHFVDNNLQNDNDLLEKEKTLFQSETVQIWPELYVNSRAIRGNIQSLEEVESAVCGGYSDPIPQGCYDYFEYEDDSIGFGYIILMVILSAMIMFLILFGVFKCYYHRKFKNQIDGEVNNVIQKYMSFNDETDNS